MEDIFDILLSDRGVLGIQFELENFGLDNKFPLLGLILTIRPITMLFCLLYNQRFNDEI